MTMARIIAVALLVIVAVARGIGSVVLAVRGPTAADSDLIGQGTALILSLGLLVVSVLALVAAIGLIRKQKWAAPFALVAPLAFVVDGALNGYLLFGKPGAGGTAVNVVAAGAIIGFVLLAKRRGELRGAA